jgi:hypothetical protein
MATSFPAATSALGHDANDLPCPNIETEKCEASAIFGYSGNAPGVDAGAGGGD